MDTYRGIYLDSSAADDWPDGDFAEEETPHEPPPSPIGQDERRMQVRAYNHWASLLEDRSFPAIDDLDPEALPDFGPYSVMLDFTAGIDNPAIRFLGDKLAEECGTQGKIDTLADVPARSLLSRITDHYMQILANQAPIGFEAEFVNQRGRTILYRGILLPFSSNNEEIDFIYGVINWKELADQATTDELMHEIDQALEVNAPTVARREEPIAAWADGPADSDLSAIEFEGDEGDDADGEEEDILDLATLEVADEPQAPAPEPRFTGFASLFAPSRADDEEEDEPIVPFDLRSLVRARDNDNRAPLDLDAFASSENDVPVASNETEECLDAPADESASALELTLADESDMGLADWLASARELADAARGSEDRTRNALYQAIGKAYDFALAADEAPAEFADLIIDSGLTVQERAPMIPVVKLVFGADYDKTRLTEYASALSHGRRLGLGRGALAGYLASAPGGLKGVITEERRLKREESGKDAVVRDCPREALAKKLRLMDHVPLDAVATEGAEFTLLVARRLPTGEVVLLGEVADDIPLLEKAAKKLLG